MSASSASLHKTRPTSKISLLRSSRVLKIPQGCSFYNISGEAFLLFTHSHVSIFAESHCDHCCLSFHYAPPGKVWLPLNPPIGQLETTRSLFSLHFSKLKDQNPQTLFIPCMLQPPNHLGSPPLDAVTCGAENWMQYCRYGLTRAE